MSFLSATQGLKYGKQYLDFFTDILKISEISIDILIKISNIWKNYKINNNSHFNIVLKNGLDRLIRPSAGHGPSPIQPIGPKSNWIGIGLLEQAVWPMNRTN